MKKIVLLVIMIAFLAACNSGDGKSVRVSSDEEVLESFANGTPRLVREYEEADGKRTHIFEKEFYEDGNLAKEGSLKDGQKDGEWKSYYRSGKLWSEGFFKDGKRNDTTVAYYENGNVKYVGIFQDGNKTGTWKLFTEEGELEKTQIYMAPGEIRTDSISVSN